ncbi:hypothetical protein LTR67_011300 [Exophiala xenobiotica]
MGDVQPTLEIDHLLNDDDCDIQIEYDSVVDGALDMRRKFFSVLRQAQQLKTKLLAKQAELDRYITQHERQRPDLREIAKTTRTKLREQSRKLWQCKDENRLLRNRNRELANKLEVTRQELEEVDYLRCDLCTVAFKNAMVPCGHTSCRGCLGLWLGQGKGCPWCRRSFDTGDIRDIYLESSPETRDAPEDDGDVTDVISLAGDSE